MTTRDGFRFFGVAALARVGSICAPLSARRQAQAADRGPSTGAQCRPHDQAPCDGSVPRIRRTRMPVTTDRPAEATAIRPFTIDVPEADLEDLRARIAATHWPEKETV